MEEVKNGSGNGNSKEIVKFNDVSDMSRVIVPVETVISVGTFKQDVNKFKESAKEQGLSGLYFTTTEVNENGNKKQKIMARATFPWNHMTQFLEKVKEAGLEIIKTDNHNPKAGLATLLDSDLSHCDFNDSIITMRGKYRDRLKELLGEKAEGTRVKAQREILEAQMAKAKKANITSEQMKAIFG